MKTLFPHKLTFTDKKNGTYTFEVTKETAERVVDIAFTHDLVKFPHSKGKAVVRVRRMAVVANDVEPE